MADDPTCKAIAEAVVGINNKVGCVPNPITPTFPDDTRFGKNGKVTLLKHKFRKLGIRT